ncbi:MAG TPA: acyl carrier protein [Clostridiales bacterium]|nr:acyl carrier protein [Clostridiales bacterium]
MIEEKVFGIISEQFDVDKSKLSLETDLVKDLHADSLDLVELIMAFEDEFGLTIPDDVALTVKTLGDAVEYIRSAE